MPLTTAQKLYDLERRIEQLEQALAVQPAPDTKKAETVQASPSRQCRREHILAEAAKAFYVTADDIRGSSRSPLTCRAREAAAHLLFESGFSNEEISNELDRHPSASNYLRRNAKEALKTSTSAFAQSVYHAWSQIGNNARQEAA